MRLGRISDMTPERKYCSAKYTAIFMLWIIDYQ